MKEKTRRKDSRLKTHWSALPSPHQEGPVQGALLPLCRADPSGDSPHTSLSTACSRAFLKRHPGFSSAPRPCLNMFQTKLSSLAIWCELETCCYRCLTGVLAIAKFCTKPRYLENSVCSTFKLGFQRPERRGWSDKCDPGTARKNKTHTNQQNPFCSPLLQR